MNEFKRQKAEVIIKPAERVMIDHTARPVFGPRKPPQVPKFRVNNPFLGWHKLYFFSIVFEISGYQVLFILSLHSRSFLSQGRRYLRGGGGAEIFFTI